MTWWAEEQTKQEVLSLSAKARQRWENLRSDVRELSPTTPTVGTSFLARFPMSGWQRWRRVDAIWCEIVDDAAAAPGAD
jgi:hypothetical protein